MLFAVMAEYSEPVKVRGQDFFFSLFQKQLTLLLQER